MKDAEAQVEVVPKAVGVQVEVVLKAVGNSEARQHMAAQVAFCSRRAHYRGPRLPAFRWPHGDSPARLRLEGLEHLVHLII